MKAQFSNGVHSYVPLSVAHTNIHMCEIYWSCCTKWHWLSLFFRASMKMARFSLLLYNAFCSSVSDLLYLKIIIFFFSLSILSFQWAKVCSSLARSLCFKHFSIQSPLLRIASLLLLSFCRFYSFINVACRIYDDCQLCCPSHHIVRHRACLSTAICICAFVHLCFKIFLYIRKMQ